MNTPNFRTFRVFISSSFKDMHGERDYLNATVFPRLDAWLADRGWRLQAMDLRGSTADASVASEEAVLRMCLSGVEYCRPYFLGLIGDRYGWVPEGPAAEDALANISTELGLPYAELTGKSATHLEIYYALQQLPREKCFFYTREIENPAGLPEGEYVQDQAAQQALKDEIAQAMLPQFAQNLRSYSAQWQKNGFTGLQHLGDLIFADLQAAFERDMQADGADDVSRPEKQAAFYFAQKADGSVPMPQVEDIVAHAMGGSEEAVLLLSGGEGTGKSSLAGQSVRRLQQEDCLLLPYVGGMDPATSTLNDMVAYFTARMMQYLDEQGVEYDPEFEKEYAFGPFDMLLRKAAAHTQVVFVIDGLQALGTSPEVREFLWIDVGLPKNIRYVMVVPQKGFYVSHAHRRIVLSSACTAQELAQVMKAAAAKRGKTFDDGILALAAQKAAQNGTPLYAALLADYLMSMTGADYGYSQSPTAHLEWMEQAIAGMDTTTQGAFARILERAKQSLGETAEFVLGFAALAQGGVRETDLLQAMALYTQRCEEMRRQAVANSPLGHLFKDDAPGAPRVIFTNRAPANTTISFSGGDMGPAPMPDAAALLALRGLLREHLNPFALSGYWRLEHVVMRRFMLEKLEAVPFGMLYDSDMTHSEFLHGIMAETLRPLPNTDAFKRHEYLWHCFYAGAPEAAIEILYKEGGAPDIRYEVLGANLREILLAFGDDAVAFFEGMIEAGAREGRRPGDYALLYRFVCGELLELAASGSITHNACFALNGGVVQALKAWGVAERDYSFETNLYMQALKNLLRAGILLGPEDDTETGRELHAITQAMYAQMLVRLGESLLEKAPEEDVRREVCGSLSTAYRFLAAGAGAQGQLAPQACFEKALYYCRQARGEEETAAYYAELVDIYCIYANFLEDRDYLAAIQTFDEAVALGDAGLEAYLAAVDERGFFYLNLYEEWKRLSFANTRLATLYAETGLFAPAQQLFQKVISFWQRISENLAPDYTRAMEYAQWLNDAAMMLIQSEEYAAAVPVAQTAADMFGQLLAVDGENQLLLRWRWQMLRALAMCTQITGGDWEDARAQTVQAADAAGIAEDENAAYFDSFYGIAGPIAEKSARWAQNGNYMGALVAAGIELDLRCRARNWTRADTCGETLARLVPALPDYIEAARALEEVYEPQDSAAQLVRLSYALLCLGKVALYAGNDAAADAAFTQLAVCAEELRTHKDSYAVRPGQTVCYELGEYHRKAGRLRQAVEFYNHSREFAAAMRDRPLDLTMGNLYCLCSIRLADVLTLAGNGEAAQELYAGTKANLESILQQVPGVPGPTRALAEVKRKLAAENSARRYPFPFTWEERCLYEQQQQEDMHAPPEPAVAARYAQLPAAPPREVLEVFYSLACQRADELVDDGQEQQGLATFGLAAQALLAYLEESADRDFLHGKLSAFAYMAWYCEEHGYYARLEQIFDFACALFEVLNSERLRLDDLLAMATLYAMMATAPPWLQGALDHSRQAVALYEIAAQHTALNEHHKRRLLACHTLLARHSPAHDEQGASLQKARALVEEVVMGASDIVYHMADIAYLNMLADVVRDEDEARRYAERALETGLALEGFCREQNLVYQYPRVVALLADSYLACAHSSGDAAMAAMALLAWRIAIRCAPDSLVGQAITLYYEPPFLNALNACAGHMENAAETGEMLHQAELYTQVLDCIEWYLDRIFEPDFAVEAYLPDICHAVRAALRYCRLIGDEVREKALLAAMLGELEEAETAAEYLVASGNEDYRALLAWFA